MRLRLLAIALLLAGCQHGDNGLTASSACKDYVAKSIGVRHEVATRLAKAAGVAKADDAWGFLMDADCYGQPTRTLGETFASTTHAVVATFTSADSSDAELQEALVVLRTRVGPVGLVTRRGDDLVVALPDGSEQMARALVRPVDLEFRQVLAERATGISTARPSGLAPYSLKGFASGSCPSSSGVMPTNDDLACTPDNSVVYRLGPVRVTAADVAKAKAEQNAAGAWTISLSFNRAGQARFTQLSRDTVTGRHESPTDQIAIVLSGQVISAPQTQSVIPRDVSITGAFGQSDAEVLSHEIGGSTLAIPLEIKDVVPLR